jgi:hypothetical protein
MISASDTMTHSSGIPPLIALKRAEAELAYFIGPAQGIA